MLSGLHQSKQLKIFGAILALSFAFISAHPVSAIEPTYATDGSPIEHGVNLELSVAPTLQVVIPASTVSLNLTPNPDPSIPVFASSNLVVSVATNNPTGYSLMLKANSTNLTNTVADREGNYAILPTLVDQVGGYTEDSFTTNAWGYRNTNTLLNNIATTTIPGNYNAFTTSSEILSSKLPTNLDQTSLDFAAKVDITQPAGTYELALNFEAVTNVIPGVVTINYEPNGADNPDAMERQQFEVVSPEHLTPNAYTKENYVFIGWNTAKDGSGAHYDNNQLYVPPEGTIETSNIGLTLYAQWALAMQAVTTSQCTETPTKVADTRDNTVYAIQRLNDGNCWMMGNLMLGSTEPINLTPNDTNITENYTLPASVNNGFTGDTSGRTIARINIDSREITDSYGSRYGTYYNYCAASAGQICMDSNGGTSATTDICPARWRMPTGGPNGEIATLSVAYGGLAIKMDSSTTPTSTEMAIILQETLKIPFSGGFNSSSAYSQGQAGRFWTSTYSDDIRMRDLYFDESSVQPQGTGERRTGFPVRCVLKEPLNSIIYMQDITSDIVSSATEGAKTTLADKRDNKTYTVAKINGQLWMTQNLAFAGTTLTAADSNVTTTRTISWSNLTSGNDYSAPRMIANSTYGAWYNYAGATAGTITGTSNSAEASESICPAGWRLPTNTEQFSITDYISIFSPVGGGYYYDGLLNATNSGHWWSSVASNTAFRYHLSYNGNNFYSDDGNRYDGIYVRCIDAK